MFLLVLKGKIKHSNKEFNHKDLLVFCQEGEEISYKSMGKSQVICFVGEPIRESIAAYGSFVMNTKEEITQAIKDYEAGKMGTLE